MMPIGGLYEKAMEAFNREGRPEAGVEAVIETVCAEMQTALLCFRPEGPHREEFLRALGTDRTVDRMIRIGIRVGLHELANPQPMAPARRNVSAGIMYNPEREISEVMWGAV